MTGTVVKRPWGAWAYTVELGKDANGKRRQQWRSGFPTKREAQAALTAELHALQTGGAIEPHRLTVAQYLDQWLANYAKSNTSPKTYERYEEIVTLNLKPALGHHKLSKLQALHIQTFYNEAMTSGRRNKTGGLSARSVLQFHRILRQALQHAVRWQMLTRNVADAVEAPRVQRKEMPTISESQVLGLLEQAAKTPIYIPTLLCVMAGLRRGEALALRWSDVNLQTGVAAVRRAVEETKKSIRFKEPKNGKARVVPLPSLVVDELRTHLTAQAENRALLGNAYEDEDLICGREDGSLLKPMRFTQMFAALADAADVPIRLHDLRHTHATQLLQQGTHPKVVSERLGHSSIAITMDLYSHVTPNMQQDAADKMDQMYRRTKADLMSLRK